MNKEQKRIGYKNLGYRNGWWKGIPVEFQNCKAAGHQTETNSNYVSCNHVTYCDVCKIKWQTDSSG